MSSKCCLEAPGAVHDAAPPAARPEGGGAGPHGAAAAPGARRDARRPRHLDSEAGEDSALARVELHRLVRLFDLGKWLNMAQRAQAGSHLKESPLLMTRFPRVVKFLSLTVVSISYSCSSL